jgi:regulator of PEP synthase PpsR (kinase-PPPase family)
MKTPRSEIDKRYEDKHKEERKARHMVWGTSVDRGYAEEINEYLQKNKLTKVDLIVAGYQALQNQYGPKKTE